MSIHLQERMAKRAVTKARVHRVVCLEPRRYLRVVSSDNFILFDGLVPPLKDFSICGARGSRIDLSDSLVKKGAR